MACLRTSRFRVIEKECFLRRWWSRSFWLRQGLAIKKIKLSYFRTRAGYEVDLIVEYREKLYAVEIKSGQINVDDARKLEAIKNYSEDFDGFYIVSPDSRSRQIGDVSIRDLPAFLKEIGL